MINFSTFSKMLQFLCLLLFSLSSLSSATKTHQGFLRCLSIHSTNSTSISKVVYTRHNASYSSVLQFSLRNPRFNTTSTPKPVVIVTPVEYTQIQSVIVCSKKHDMQVRIRSGGHDFEGLSYVSHFKPFVVIDMINLRNISIDVASRTAWIGAGATLGQVYYTIAQNSRTLAFPGGICPTVGIGGHASGGGYGALLRKYGLAADNVIDAYLIDARGRLLERSSMGEDLFWAIRGGGGNTFGVVVAWKVNLVQVPSTVTVFSIPKTLEQNATKLVHRWQYVADKLPEDLYIFVNLRRFTSTNTTVTATFYSLYLGGVDSLLQVMQERFPELGVTKEDCSEMSWINSTLVFAPEYPRNSLEVLLDRTPIVLVSFKGKSDYVQNPMSESGVQGMIERCSEAAEINLIPYGGKMSEIPESSIPYPHRAGTIYSIAYQVAWLNGDNQASKPALSWIRELFNYLTPYVSKNPRSAYVNYRDLDIGANNLHGKTSYRRASIWGRKYFKNNFDRLVQIKTKVDPTNFFRNEQSIPPLTSWQ